MRWLTRRPFLHYTLFLIIPSGFVIGAILGEILKIVENAPGKHEDRVGLFNIGRRRPHDH